MKPRLFLFVLLSISFTIQKGNAQQLLGGIHLKSGIPTGTFDSESGISVIPEFQQGYVSGAKSELCEFGGNKLPNQRQCYVY